MALDEPQQHAPRDLDVRVAEVFTKLGLHLLAGVEHPPAHRFARAPVRRSTFARRSPGAGVRSTSPCPSISSTTFSAACLVTPSRSASSVSRSPPAARARITKP